MPNHKVMNCKDFLPEKFVPGSLGTFKVDGVRAFYYPRTPHLISRDNKPLYGFQHIIDIMERYNIDEPVDMELWIPDIDDWNKMAGLIRNHNSVPEARATVIDLPGYNVMMLDRSACIHMLASLDDVFDPYNPRRLTTVQEAYAMHIEALSKGYEGVVIKTPNHLYRNSRSYDWMRIVPIGSEDCKILDIYEGKGKMSGMLGGFIVDFKGIKCKVGTLLGFDYPMRQEAWEDPDLYIGMTLEVEFKELQPSGKPRQPRGKGIRYDK